MTTRRPGSQPTPEQIVAGGPPPTISIISERPIETQPIPGQVVHQVAVTYRLAPNPPEVIFVPLESLPHWVYRRDHPGNDVPPAIQKQGDDALRQMIRTRRHPTGPPPRMI